MPLVADNLGSGSIDSMIFVSLPLKNKIVRKIYHNGFYYCRSKCIYGTTYWVCDRAKQDNCRSRITTFDDKRTYKVTNPVHNHNHCLQNSFSVSHVCVEKVKTNHEGDRVLTLQFHYLLLLG